MAILTRAAAALAATTAVAHAHVVPIPPSQCRFDPVTLAAPASGVAGRAADATGDGVRLVYDANASVVRLCSTDGGSTCGPSVARSFTLGSSAGTIDLPARASGTMASSGDLLLPGASVTVTVDGVATPVPVTLTTGLVAIDGVVMEGTPLQGLAGFTLVGALDGAALPAAFDGRSVGVSISCTPRPIPDTDQFVAPSRLAGLRGDVTGTTAHLRATIVRGQADVFDLADGPVLATIRIDDRRVAAVTLTGGVHGGRRLTGTSDDGRADVVLTKRSANHVGLALTVRDLDAGVVGDARAIVGVTFDSGGLLARGERLFRPASGGGLRRR